MTVCCDRSCSFGLQDTRLALEWVKRNIAAFGGDRMRDLDTHFHVIADDFARISLAFLTHFSRISLASLGSVPLIPRRASSGICSHVLTGC